ncbi:MAG: cobalt-precorrin 5A hydrolase [Oscillospiraceae bacterium]|nr:cobalt-precorrin 5A hydrolase [Oscillospiraceae bacterium]
MKRIAVISLTERGRALSLQIQMQMVQFEISRFCFYKHTDSRADEFRDLAVLTKSVFRQFDALIFVCACGIAVRMIAPHICSKQTDPAVLAADDRGQYVIPLLSGHLGGANALAQRIASEIHAHAVITTATDIGGLFSPDSFAAANHLLMDDPEAAKEIAAAVLDGEKIGLHCTYPYRNLPAELILTDEARCGIVIADSAGFSPYPVTLHLIPKNIVAGIGCKRGIPHEKIEAAVVSRMTAAGIDERRICAVSSIDRKADEPGLLLFCKMRNVPFHTFSAGQLMQLAGDFSHSDFVETVTGTDNICERSAVLCSGGALVMSRTAGDGITVAAAARPVEIDFEKRML